MYIPSRFIIEDDDLDLLWRFTAYIEKVIVHARIDYLRRQGHRQHEVPLDNLTREQEAYSEDIIPPSKNEFVFEEDKHTEAFARLKQLRQKILTLVFVEGLSAQETAERLNCSVNDVYLEKHRAIKALRDQLVEEVNPHGE